MQNTKKKFVAPLVTQVINEELMAVCNENFVYTSAGGVTSTGYARVCYHFPVIREITGYTFITIATNNYNQYSTDIVNLPPGCTFVPPKQQGTWQEGNVQYNVTDEIGIGWQDFQGTNGTCHFIGFIYAPDGTLISNKNVSQYVAK